MTSVPVSTYLTFKLICLFHGVLQTQRNMSVLFRFWHEFALQIYTSFSVLKILCLSTNNENTILTRNYNYKGTMQYIIRYVKIILGVVSEYDFLTSKDAMN